jgi:hypothetical protein
MSVELSTLKARAICSCSSAGVETLDSIFFFLAPCSARILNENDPPGAVPPPPRGETGVAPEESMEEEPQDPKLLAADGVGFAAGGGRRGSFIDCAPDDPVGVGLDVFEAPPPKGEDRSPFEPVKEEEAPGRLVEVEFPEPVEELGAGEAADAPVLRLRASLRESAEKGRGGPGRAEGLALDDLEPPPEECRSVVGIAF